MKELALLAVLVSASPPIVLPATAPPPPASAPILSEPPDPREADQWARVRRANSVAAYAIYLRRFPGGPNADAAIQAIARLQGRPMVYAPPAPPAPPPPTTSNPCLAMLVQRPEPEEARDYRAVRRDNRPAEFRRYLARYPAGACRAEIAGAIERREARRAAIVRIPGLGPLPPHRLRALVITGDDYPAAALRAEETGTAVATWEVAEDGEPEVCRIVYSSGSRTLDEATCSLIVRRMSYDPARDSRGHPIRWIDSMSVRWVHPLHQE